MTYNGPQQPFLQPFFLLQDNSSSPSASAWMLIRMGWICALIWYWPIAISRWRLKASAWPEKVLRSKAEARGRHVSPKANSRKEQCIRLIVNDFDCKLDRERVLTCEWWRWTCELLGLVTRRGSQRRRASVSDFWTRAFFANCIRTLLLVADHKLKVLLLCVLI